MKCEECNGNVYIDMHDETLLMICADCGLYQESGVDKTLPKNKKDARYMGMTVNGYKYSEDHSFNINIRKIEGRPKKTQNPP